MELRNNTFTFYDVGAYNASTLNCFAFRRGNDKNIILYFLFPSSYCSVLYVPLL